MWGSSGGISSDKSGKIWIFLIIPILLALSTINVASAHGPTGMELQYDNNTEALEVSITHTVENPNDHYIDRIEVRKNGELIISDDYTNQPTDSTFSYTFDVTADMGDSLEVMASCNRFGSITETINLSENGPTKPDDGGAPWLYIGILLTIVVIAAVSLAYRKL